MANYKRGSGYAPKMDSNTAYDLLPSELKRSIQEAMQPWSCYHVLKHYKKYGLDRTITWIRNGDISFVKQGFVPAHGRRQAVPSSYVECKVDILRANY